MIGHVSWRQITAGNAYANDRGVYLDTTMDQITRTGTTTDGTLRVDWGASGYSGTDGSNPPCKIMSNASNPTLLSQWQAGGIASHNIYSDRADGYGRDSVSRCSIASYTLNARAYSPAIASGGMRSDSASYLPNLNGAIFDRVVPVFASYSRSSTSNGQVAQHIFDAQSDPASTWPPVPGKSIPGSIASGKPLSRLYPGWDAAATTAYNNNRSVVQNTCAQLPGLPGQECDEYPFASTWEGAGKGDNNFSVRYVDATQNQSAGGTLGSWYGTDRILHRDQFYVSIQP